MPTLTPANQRLTESMAAAGGRTASRKVTTVVQVAWRSVGASMLRQRRSVGRGARQAAAAALCVLGVTPAAGRCQTLAITRVTVIDGRSAAPRPNQSVLLRGNRIVAIGRSDSVPLPPGAQQIDGRGKFLIPGLWDMHVHTVMPGGRTVLPLYLANGVTGVRDMAGDWEQLQAWRRDIAAGRLRGPRMVVSGPYIEGGDVPIPHLLARTPDEARQAVDSLVRLGVDFIKLHSQFRREVFFAAARRARERGIPFTGHVPRSIGAIEASDSGQRSLEHLLQIPSPCTPAESTALAPRFQVQSVLARCSSADLSPLWATLVRNGTWVVPTLVAQYEVANWPDRSLPGDAYAKYLPDSLRRYVAEIFPMPDDVPAGANTVGLQLFERRVAVVGIMHRAGVAVMPGTDAPLRNSPPGFGLHEELALFARAGLSNFDILRAATWEPARYFGMTDSLGTVTVGKLADLVLLEANPLEDIANLRRISAVVANGRLMTSDERSSLLKELAKAALAR
ncbi:MAG: amidohydrolase family protein [Gemmatimonadaceae bacterium]